MIPVTVIFLYTSTILTSIYLMCCISLLHGAVKYKREYVLPWIMAACVAVVLLIVAIVIGDGYPCVINLFGGHNLYREYLTKINHRAAPTIFCPSDSQKLPETGSHFAVVTCIALNIM